MYLILITEHTPSYENVFSIACINNNNSMYSVSICKQSSSNKAVSYYRLSKFYGISGNSGGLQIW